MISEEGQPSRIISKPEVLEAKQPVEPVKPAEPVVEVAAAPVVEEAPVKKVVVAPAEPAQQVAPETESVATTELKPVEVAKVEPQPVKIEAEPEVVESKPEKIEAQPEKADSVENEPVVQVAAVEPEPEQPAKVMVQPAEVVEQPKFQSIPAAPQVVVEAVEVEGGQIFIAGAIPSGVPVRIYVDNKFIGLARGTSDNRFLVSKPFELEEGEHTVRADVIDTTNGSVLARAIVPLIHEIPQELEPETPEATVVAEAEEPTPVATPKAAAVKVEKPVEVAALETPKPAVTKPETTAKTPASPVVTPKPVEQPAKPVAKTAEPKVETVEVVNADPVVEVAAATPPPTPTPRMPKVLKTGRAVIIKRGDNLWRISRKTYGRGIRYTTIYNANRNQISDPHRIFIGQIFKIPKKPEQEG
ncbi:MAG: LysM peptidoglycan-binding domain-containing protein [Rhizobiaceae bacterium]|nr:LysM peptidoglycan-binding domain-containing protein [Rhizobiaceae bacterium]